MKYIIKRRVRGSNHPLYEGNGILSIDRNKIKKFINPQSSDILKILKK